MNLNSENILPEDSAKATLIGRAHIPGLIAGPSPVLVKPDFVYDLSGLASTSAELLARADVVIAVKDAASSGYLKRVGATVDVTTNSAASN